MRQALIIGTGAIGKAVAQHGCRDARFQQVITVGRSALAALGAGHTALSCDHSAEAIDSCVAQVGRIAPALTHVIITLGTLHGDGYGPEKALRQIDAAVFGEVHRVNCILPLSWVAALEPLLRRAEDCRVLVLSARVGSLGDNRRGGWYAYRSSKAALNMGLQCAAIELAQRNRGVKLIAYHPGTVDSALSAPFQARLPPGQLRSPEDAARSLLEVMDQAPRDGTLSYLDWRGQPIPW